MIIPVRHILPTLSPHLEKLIARLIGAYAPRSIATLSCEKGAPAIDLGRAIPLRPVARRGDVSLAAVASIRGTGKSPAQADLLVYVGLTRQEDKKLRQNAALVPGYEVKEDFYFGFFLFPFLWLLWLPFGRRLLAGIFSLEVRLHPYLNLVAGVGSIYVLQKRRQIKGEALDLSCVIPAYNEALRLPSYLPSVISYFKARRLKHEIIVVDDGSRDGTAQVVAKKFKTVRALKLYQNFGKGAAVREGVMAARAKTILVCDADGATPIGELAKLEQALHEGADIAIGSRYLAQSSIGIRQSFARRLVSRLGNLLIRTLLDLPYRDTQCGFKLFERRAGQYVFRNLTNLRFGFDFEVLKKAAVLNLVVAEVPVRWNDQDGSKVTFKQTLRVLIELLQLRFGHLFKFAVVGVINTLADFSVHNALIVFFGNGDRTRQLVYMVAAFLCANLVAFSLHSGFTFRRRAAYARFFTVSVFTLAVSALIFHGLNLLYNPGNSILLTNAFKLSTVLISFITNYFGYKFWVYRYTV